ncbi:MAG: ACP S-malonyltransferase, partial [Myxococcales bacterium]|nr:ACP S-malonyltransferase [Myxococcales bacterium]
MLAFLFPGQGSQVPGMGRSIAETWTAARSVFEEADDALGLSLSKTIFDGTEDDLRQTSITQPAILTTSIAILRALEVERPGIRPSFAAGHSLGEWTALVAVGALRFV